MSNKSSKSIWKSEAQFQAACVKWFDRTFPEQRGRLIGIYNNPPNAIVGAMLLSMGVKPGISDLVYFPVFTPVVPMPSVVWIELKTLGKKQNDNQIKFEATVKGFGHEYHVVTEEEIIFQNLINSYQ